MLYFQSMMILSGALQNDKNSACIIIHTPWSKGLFQLGYLVQAWGWDGNFPCNEVAKTALFNFTNYSYFK